jgi:hypothetical protein
MDNDLQFDRADFAAPRATTCSACKAALTTEYFAVNGQVFCARCAEGIRQHFGDAAPPAEALGRAAALGLGAALVGGAVYAAVMIGSSTQWGIISVGIGWLVGKGVRKGSGNRGGWVFQMLAAFLTYTAIAGAYAADIVHDFGAPEGLADISALVITAYGRPITSGLNSIFGLIIVAIGVWEAWRLNAPVKLEISGPHALGGTTPSAGA